MTKCHSVPEVRGEQCSVRRGARVRRGPLLHHIAPYRTISRKGWKNLLVLQIIRHIFAASEMKRSPLRDASFSDAARIVAASEMKRSPLRDASFSDA